MANLSAGLCTQKRYSNTDYWFSEDPLQELKARSICDKCPVKFECAQTALKGREAWGIWGGMEEFRMRRALGVDSRGQNRVYTKKLVCPFCFSSDLKIARKREVFGYPVQCNTCSIEWPSYRVPDKARKTLKRQHDNVANSVGNSRGQ